MFAESLLEVSNSTLVDAAVTGFARDAHLRDTELPLLQQYAAARVDAIRALAAALPEVDDETDLYRTLAALWLELRFEWQRNNDVMNYQFAQTGAADPRVVAEGSVGSYVLSRIETLLDPAHLEVLTKYAIDLLETVKADTAPHGSTA